MVSRFAIRPRPQISPAAAAEELLFRRRARKSMVEYVRALDLGFEPARHHRLIIEYLEAVERRDIPRIMLAMPPGSAKSTYGNVLFCPWYLGKNPTHNALSCSHSMSLAERFGRKSRNIFASSEHKRVFDGVTVSADSSAAGAWTTTKGGEFMAFGVTSGIAGSRGDIGIIDDPFPNRSAADSKTIRDAVWEWYKSDFLPRLKPNASQIVIMTRWHTDDLAGRLLKEMKEGGPEWTVVELQMECTQADDLLERKIGERLWPDWFTDEMVKTAKRDARNWASMYQQRPTIDGGNILKKSDWKLWTGRHPPECEYIVQSYDTAFSERDHKDASYSARTTWGVFFDRDNRLSMMLIEAWHDRVDYPTLRKLAKESYLKYEPDCVLIENKASGQSLIQDMRSSGIPVIKYQPDRDKVSRAYAVQAMLEGGQIYYPDRPWAHDVIDECAVFPNGENDDYVDTCTQAWLRIRNAGLLIPKPEDDPIEPDTDELFPRSHLADGKWSQSIYG